MQNCFRVGLFKQGLLHDLSKYSPAEISDRSSLLSGDRSPNAAEREEKGDILPPGSTTSGPEQAPFEYWIDFSRTSQGIAEQDAGQLPGGDGHGPIAACKVYRGKD